ncbi:SAM pointed domain-containing Ets transcription factor-like isoform X1 [Haliotis rufescens]|uniref:SAM pointed domain-containing Ets transcription factor-like isoform X1 n=2 Tax=Haliotis rufescens TaxID=6454 RepID=UPI001EB01492|nr:SAM pointed domain-containing Ets transcription factor-like isoform X1 [Haliotis rufescens]
MPTDFHVIKLYHDLCQTPIKSEDMLHSDQQVPQTNTVFSEDFTRVSVKTEPEVYQYDFTGNILDTFSSAAFPAPLAGCTSVTEVPDQQLNEGGSPTHLIDLDMYDRSDITMYDQNVSDDKQVQQVFYPTPNPDIAMDDGLDVLYVLATRDIKEECVVLQICKDPTRWSTEDVGKWITHMCRKMSIPDVTLELFDMNGKCLCLLSQADFEWRSPVGGPHLHAQLEIWKNYFKMEEISETGRFQSDSLADSPMTLEGSRFCASPSSSSPGSPGSSSLDSNPSSPPRSQMLDELFTYRASTHEKEEPREKTAPLPTQHKQTIHLWQFLKDLLLKPQSFSGCIKWVDRSKGIFKIEDSGRVAKEWGRRKNRPLMNYDKLSRSIRQYYKKGIIRKTEHSKRLVYQFCAPYL